VARPKTSTIVRELLEEPPKKKKKKRTAKKTEPAKEAALERVLARVSAEPPPPSEKRVAKPRETVAPAPGLRTARIVTAAGRAAEILFRGERAPVTAAVSEDVDAEVLKRAADNRDAVLVEIVPDAPPLVVGIVQTKMPRSIHLKGTTVEIEADREILLKTQRGALRIREDGDIEVVGSRIVAMSRGLFRIVGKMLRLN
jgi:hypothetical protein